MRATLRSSLLFSFGLLIAVLMLVFSLGSVAALLRNPLVYESAAQQLRTGQRRLENRSEQLLAQPRADLAALARQAERTAGVRVLIFDNNGTLLADSQESNPALRIPAVRTAVLRQRNEIGFIRDQKNYVWLALVQPLDEDRLALLAARRPPLAVWEFFSSELLRPVTLAGLVGLALSIFISLGMTAWISAPLKRIGAAADRVSAGEYQPIEEEGPVEVRGLARSFNHMIARVEGAQQAQRDLVANVSHELKTPLTSIQGFTQSILEGVSQTPEAVQQAAQVIYRETNRMNRLVQDLVVLARLEAGTADLRRELVDMAGLLRATAEKFQPQAKLANLTLSVDAGEPLWVLGDEDRLAQVLSNLVDNAIKFNLPGGWVRVSAQAFGTGMRILVADTGRGIPEGDRARVFERFFRSDSSRSGMGLGLAITRQIVLAHGGSITVEANSSRGVVFIVALPAVKLPGSGTTGV